MNGNNTIWYEYWQSTSLAVTRMIVRQFCFPPLLKGMVELAALAGAFLIAGFISLGIPVVQMLVPMVPVVALMGFCMIASGIYREEIAHSIVKLYVHSLYGFALAAIGFLLITRGLPAEYTAPKFVFFFLFFAFFVTNTIRPLIGGTDFVDGGGRRGN